MYSLLPDRTVADLQLVRSALETFGLPSLPRPAALTVVTKALSLIHLSRPTSPSAGVRPRQMQSKSQGFGTAGRCHITQTGRFSSWVFPRHH